MQLFTLIFEVIKSIWGWIYLFSPLKMKIVHEGEGGVKYAWGKVKRNLKVGCNWGGMGSTFQSFGVRLCKAEIDDAISCFSKDAIPLEIFAVFTYDIIDAAKFSTNSEDAEWLLAELVETRVKEVVGKSEFLILLDKSDSINNKLLRQVQKDADSLDIGLKIRRARLNYIKCTDPVLLRSQKINHVLDGLASLDLENKKIAAAIISAAAPIQEINKIESIEASVGGEEEGG